MNQPLLDALNAGTAETAAAELRGETATVAFRAGVKAFFEALPDGTARDIMARKLPFHSWQKAFAAEISLVDLSCRSLISIVVLRSSTGVV